MVTLPPPARLTRPLIVAQDLGFAVEAEARGGGSDGNWLWERYDVVDGLGPSGYNAHCSAPPPTGTRGRCNCVGVARTGTPIVITPSCPPPPHSMTTSHCLRLLRSTHRSIACSFERCSCIFYELDGNPGTGLLQRLLPRGLHRSLIYRVVFRMLWRRCVKRQRDGHCERNVYFHASIVGEWTFLNVHIVQ